MSDEAIHILSTGALPGFTHQGTIQLDIIPFLSIQLNPFPEISEKIKELISSPASVVFTSANAVDAVLITLKGAQPSWKIYCIAHSTKARVKEYFTKSTVAGQGSNSADIAEQIIKDGTTSVQFFCGNLRRDDIPLKMKENNIALAELVVYKTVYTPVELDKKYQGILFFSPGAVESFFAVNNIDPSAIIFSIGETTERAVREYCNNRIFTGNKPDKLELAQIAIKYFEEKINQ